MTSVAGGLLSADIIRVASKSEVGEGGGDIVASSFHIWIIYISYIQLYST